MIKLAVRYVRKEEEPHQSTLALDVEHQRTMAKVLDGPVKLDLLYECARE